MIAGIAACESVSCVYCMMSLMKYVWFLMLHPLTLHCWFVCINSVNTGLILFTGGFSEYLVVVIE